jgi:peptide/nickel transport system permease protein
MANMIKYIVKRIILTIPMVFILMIGTWVLVQFVPGDPTSSFPLNTPMEKIEYYRELWHLNDPWHVQLWSYIKGVFRGDFGESVVIAPETKVSEFIPSLIARSIEISLLPTILIPIFGIKSALISVKHKNKWQDTIIRGFSVLFAATPSFFFALILQLIFGYRIPEITQDAFDVPVVGLKTPGFPDPDLPISTGFRMLDCLIANELILFMDTAKHLILPVVCSTFLSFASITRHTRSSMLEILEQDYIRTARAKGCSRELVYNKHALRNALLPTMTLVISKAFNLIAGSVLIETVFGIRGIGLIMLQAVIASDYWLVVGITVVIGTVVIIGNLVADIAYTIIDPRIMYE